MDHDPHRDETPALGLRRRRDQRFGGGGSECRSRARRIAGAGHRLFHRLHRDARLLLPGHAVDKPAFDIAIACSGFIYGLTVASGLVRSGVYRRIMLIGAETLSKILDKDDRATAILFGDGAGAVVLERSQQDSCLASELGADGSRPELLYAQGSGWPRPLDHKALDEKVHLIHMQGPETF